MSQKRFLKNSCEGETLRNEGERERTRLPTNSIIII